MEKSLVETLRRAFLSPDLESKTREALRSIHGCMKGASASNAPRDLAWYVYDLQQRGSSQMEINTDYFSLPDSSCTRYRVELSSAAGTFPLYSQEMPTAEVNELIVRRNFFKAVEVSRYLRQIGQEVKINGQEVKEVERRSFHSSREELLEYAQVGK